MCTHQPCCPAAEAVDHDAARIMFDHLQENGYALLCNGVILFGDGGEIVNNVCIGRPANLPIPQQNTRLQSAPV